MEAEFEKLYLCLPFISLFGSYKFSGIFLFFFF